MNIGKRIQARRKELNISIDELAKQLNKNRTTVYRYEKGDIENLPLDALRPLAKILKTSPAYLMGWKDESSEDIFKNDIRRKRSKLWIENFDHIEFTDKEYEKIIEYSKFLISQREK